MRLQHLKYVKEAHVHDRYLYEMFEGTEFSKSDVDVLKLMQPFLTDSSLSNLDSAS